MTAPEPEPLVSPGFETSEAMRGDAVRIARAGIGGAAPGPALRRVLAAGGGVLRVRPGGAGAEGGDGQGGGEGGGGEIVLPLNPDGRVVLLAAGKAAGAMAEAAMDILEGVAVDGSITVPHGGDGGRAAARLSLWEAGHPVPDIGGLAAAAEAVALARRAGERDLVLCLLSGGASALWSAPAGGLTLDDLRAASAGLLRSGAPIEAVNTVRRHLSAIAGGQLALAARPARVMTLAVSDVVGAGPEAIGSGPTLPDPTTFQDALSVVRQHAMELPPRALHLLRRGAAGALPDTPGPDALDNVAGFEVILRVDDALAAAAAEAERLGYRARIITGLLHGEARSAGASLAAAALAARPSDGRGVALLWGGETTVTVRGEGRGGRNQELALAAALALRGEAGVVLASLGTDGRDGPTDAAGAVVDGRTSERGEATGLDAASHLDQNDSNTYLRATGDLVVTGPTGTNVNDLVVALVSPLPAAG